MKRTWVLSSDQAAVGDAFPILAPPAPAAPAMPAKADVVVVGGGVLGLLAALRLTEAGHRVVVLEARRVGSGQSSRNLGFVREQGREAVEAEAMRYSNLRWTEMAKDGGRQFGWTQGGHISIARDEESYARIAAWGEIAAAQGTSFEVVDGAEARRRLPWLGTAVEGVGWSRDDGQVEPPRVMRALERRAREVGVTVLEGAEVEELVAAGGVVTGVRVGDKTVAASAVLLAAGAWSTRLLRRSGIHVPVHAGTATVGLTTTRTALTRASVWEVGGVGFRQSRDGRVVFGMGGFVDVDVRWEDATSALRLLPLLLRNRRQMSLHIRGELARDVGAVVTGRALPPFTFAELPTNRRHLERGIAALRDLLGDAHDVRVDQAWSGVIDTTPDLLPLAGSGPLGNLAIIVGTSGHGMGLAPALADGVSELIESGSAPSLLAPFSPGRFRD